MEYVRFALSEACQPELSVRLDEEKLDRSVLDEVCQEWTNFFACADEIASNEFLLANLKSFFDKFGTEKGLVLSLSGGVDSMSMLVLLVRLKVEFVAVHIRHSSREEDTEKELVWVRWMCHRLHVPLYFHHVEVGRPHGAGAEGGLTREAFEELTREIRFGMYRKASMAAFPDQPAVHVVVGHHGDDVDENRIAELGKGSLIDLDGMALVQADACCLWQIRPWCVGVRKQAVREFATKMRIPHMHNSTPRWSRRGWIRSVLDFTGDDGIVSRLEQIGQESNSISELVKSLSFKWAEFGGIRPNQQVTISSKKRTISVDACVLNLDKLLQELGPLVQALTHLAGKVNAFSPAWNELVAVFAKSRPSESCPIQIIKEWNLTDSNHFELLLVTRVFQNCFAEIKETLGAERFVSSKSIKHLLENAAKPIFTWKVNQVDFLVISNAGNTCILSNESIAKEFGLKEGFRKFVLSDLATVGVVMADCKTNNSSLVT